MNKSEIPNLPNDMIIYMALMLDLPTLANYCRSSRKFNSLTCDSYNFWENKLLQEYDLVYLTPGDVEGIKNYYKVVTVYLQHHPGPDTQAKMERYYEFVRYHHGTIDQNGKFAILKVNNRRYKGKRCNAYRRRELIVYLWGLGIQPPPFVGVRDFTMLELANILIDPDTTEEEKIFYHDWMMSGYNRSHLCNLIQAEFERIGLFR